MPTHQLGDPNEYVTLFPASVWRPEQLCEWAPEATKSSKWRDPIHTPDPLGLPHVPHPPSEPVQDDVPAATGGPSLAAKPTSEG